MCDNNNSDDPGLTASSEPLEVAWRATRLQAIVTHGGYEELSQTIVAELATERGKREQAEQELHDLTCLLEGNPYSDPDFIKDSQALKAAIELRQQLLAAQAAIAKHNGKYQFKKISVDLSALEAALAEARTQAAREQLVAARQAEDERRKPLVDALEKLRGYYSLSDKIEIIDAALASVKDLTKTEKDNKGNNDSIT